MELNKQAMEAIKSGHFGKINGFINIIKQLEDLINKTDAGKVQIIMSFAEEETGLIPEVIIRVRKPETDDD